MSLQATGMRDTRRLERYLSLLFHPFVPGQEMPGGWRLGVPDPAGRLKVPIEKPGEVGCELVLAPRDDSQGCYLQTRNLNVSLEGHPGPGAERLLRLLAPLMQKNDQRVHPGTARKVLAQVRDAGVRSVDFSIQPVCNNNCLFCSNQPSTIGKFGTDEVMARIAREREQGANWLEFSAMEPTLRKDLPQLIEYGHSLGFEGIHVITNGQNFMNRRLAEKIIFSGVTKITVSIHSPYDETEARITSHPGSLAKKKAGIKNILEIFAQKYPHIPRSFELPLYTNTVINAVNWNLLPETVDMLLDLGVGRIHLFFPKIVGNAERDFERVIPRMSGAAPFVNEAVRRGKARGALMAVVDLPACVLQDKGESMKYRLKKEVLLTREDGQDLWASRGDVEDEKTKRPQCATCRYDRLCEGVFTGYVKRRGWDEFAPVA